MGSKVSFIFNNLKAFSANESVNFDKKGKYYKSTKKDEFQKRIFYGMLSYKPDIFSFEALYSPYEHVLVGKVYMFIPLKNIITKKECLNLTAGDVNNNKVFTDCIFKTFNKLDDAYLIDENQHKRISPDENYHMGYTLQIEDKSNLEWLSKESWKILNN